MLRYFYSLLFSIFPVFVFGQSLQILDSGAQVSFRGLSVVSEQVFWCSGSKGTLVRSVDAGKQLEWIKVKGFEERDFRDIEAFDERNILIMAIGAPALILRSKDAGQTWQKVLEDSTEGMFLDAMEFDDKGNGLVIGDPIGGKVYLARTSDYGHSWRRDTSSFSMLEGEAFFASSGTNIGTVAPYLWVSGGFYSRLFCQSKKIVLPLQNGKSSTGANSVAVHGNKAIIVGGDFQNVSNSDSNCVLLQLIPKLTLIAPKNGPNGYKSCVRHVDQQMWLCCGTSGVDYTKDDGENWETLSLSAFHVAQVVPHKRIIYLAGPNGKIARLTL